jgi:hypothetical protein
MSTTDIPTEITACALWWIKHLESINPDTTGIRPEHMSLARLATALVNLGELEGQIRTGELGKWDLYSLIVPMPTLEATDIMALCGISVEEMTAEIENYDLEEAGFDPANPADAFLARRLEQMTPEELDQEILALETLLGV